MTHPPHLAAILPGMGLTYREAGVNIDAGNELVARISGACKTTYRPETLQGVGGFAALSEIPAGYKRPVLATATDGIGTKLKLANDYGDHDGIGQDLVAMCANDILVTGAEPFVFLDYFATGRLDVDIAERVIQGVAAGCREAGCALSGGETAEMPGLYANGDYDLAGFCVGVVEHDSIVDGSRVEAGDCLLGLTADGPHSNGYSLIRAVLARQGRRPGAEMRRRLLAPTRIYVKSILHLLSKVDVHGMAHITGGGLVDNVPRIVANSDLAALVRLDTWDRPSVFDWLQSKGNINDSEMLRTFNCGIGFVLCVPGDQADEAMSALKESGESVRVIGEIVYRSTRSGAGELLLAPGLPYSAKAS